MRPPTVSTIYLETILGDPIPKTFVEILPNLKIQWDTPMVCALIIQNNKVRAMTTLRIQVGEKGVIGCQVLVSSDCCLRRYRQTQCTLQELIISLYPMLTESQPDQQFWLGRIKELDRFLAMEAES